MRTYPLLALSLAAVGCHHVSDGFFGFGPPSTTSNGLARYLDSNRDGTPNSGDRIVVAFDREILVNDAAVTPAQVFVDGDSFGTDASLEAGPRPNELSILLGDGAVLRTRGTHAEVPLGEHAPSGLRISSGNTGAVVDAQSGQDVPTTGWLDIVPEPVPGTNTGLGTSARDAIGADLNRDGLQDWIAANGPNGLDVYETLEAGGYTSLNLPLGDVLFARAADLRRSGREDLLVVTQEQVLIVVNLSPAGGPIELASLGGLDFPGTPEDLRVLDVDRDGDLDLALLSADGVRIALNDGAANFDAPGALLPDTDGRRLAVGDVDGDGVDDLIVARNGNNHLLRGSACDGLGAAEPIDGANETEDLFLVDLDRDGDADLLGAGPDGLTVWLATEGVLVLAYGLSGPATLVRALDLDGDDAPDVLLGTADGVRPLANDGTGVLVPTGGSLGVGPVVGLASGDVESDADLDVFVAFATGAPEAWHGSLQGTWGVSRLRLTAENVGEGPLLSFAAGDLNGDGDVDLVAGRNFSIEVRLGAPGAKFAENPLVTDLGDSRAHGLTLADVDQDGDLDVLAAILGTATSVWLNDGAGNLSAGPSTGEFQSALCIAAADFDGDGFPDYALGTIRGLQDRFVLNRGVDCDAEAGEWLGFDDAVTLPGTFHTGAVATSDVDLDGDADLLFAHGDMQADRLFLNDGDGNFVESPQQFTQRQTRAIAFGDLDGDGDPDLVVGKPQQDEVWHNAGDGTFVLAALLINKATRDVAIVDLDGDGHLDLIEGADLFQGFIIYSGDPTGTFAAGPRRTSGDRNIRRIFTFDADGDGAPDFLTGMEDGATNQFWWNL